MNIPGLLGRLPVSPLGPQAVRLMARQKEQQYMPQGGGRVIPAAGGVLRQPSMMAEAGSALAGAGKLLGDVGEVQQTRRRKQKQKEAQAVANAAIKASDPQSLYKAAMLYEDAGMSRTAGQMFNMADKLTVRADETAGQKRKVAENQMLARELFGSDPVALKNATALAVNPAAFNQFVGKRLGPDDPRYQFLTDDEERGLGLDVGGVYQRGPDGRVSSVQTPKTQSAGTWVDLYGPGGEEPKRVKVGSPEHNELSSSGWVGDRPQRDRKTTVSDLFVPVYQKMMAGEELSPGEVKAFEAYQRSDPMAQFLGSLFGNPDGLLDNPPRASVPAPAGKDTLYRQALEAEMAGADKAQIRARLEQNGGTWAEFERFRATNGG